MPQTILIADPDEAARDAFKAHFLADSSVIVVDSLAAACNVLKNKQAVTVTFIGVTADPSEKKLIKEIVLASPGKKLIAMADRHNEEAGIKAVKNGASGYVMKPLAAEQARALIGQ